jgi:hypothetical protein
MSLKDFARHLSTITGLSPDAIYERQRELQAAGLIESPGTRGPGAGVRATPETVATLLAALLATDVRGESVEAAKRLLSLRANQTTAGQEKPTTFGDALIGLMRGSVSARNVSDIYVHRRRNLASIAYGSDDHLEETVWYSDRPLPFEQPHSMDNTLMTILVRITGRAFQVLSEAMRPKPPGQPGVVTVTVDLTPPPGPRSAVTQIVTHDGG